jgi:hypothetical protein
MRLASARCQLKWTIPDISHGTPLASVMSRLARLRGAGFQNRPLWPATDTDKKLQHIPVLPIAE